MDKGKSADDCSDFAKPQDTVRGADCVGFLVPSGL